MRAWTRIAALALVAGGCTQSGTGVLLTVVADGVSADQLTVTARFDGQTISRDVPATARTLTFPTTLVVALPDRATTVTLTVTALSAHAVVATGTTPALAVAAHRVVPATVTLTGGAGGGSDGGGSSDGGGEATCGAPSLIADDFSGAATAASWWTTFSSGGMTATAAGGELALAFPASTSGLAEAGFNSLAWYDFRSARVRVEAVAVPPSALAAYAGLSLHLDDNTYIGMAENQGMLGFDVVDGSTRTPAGAIPWDATAQRWWQLREAAGTVYFETSPDGDTWTTQATTPTPPWARTVRVVLGAGADTPVDGAGTVRFAQLNRGIVSDSPRCAARTLTDDFADGMRSDAWLGFYSERCATSETGTLTFQPMALPSGAEYVSSYAYDLRGDSLAVEVPMPPAVGAGISAWLRAGVDELTSSGYEFLAADGKIVLQRKNPDGTVTMFATQAYDAAKHRWWRLRESGGALFYETAGDGATWTTWLTTATTTLPVAAVRVHLGLVVYDAAVSAPAAVEFARLNLPP